jgi:hypothetical protein
MFSLRRVLTMAAGLACLLSGLAGRPAAAAAGVEGLYASPHPILQYNDVKQLYEYRLVREYYLFYPDGRLYHGLPLGGLDRFDFAQAQKDEPNRCGRYEVKEDGIWFHFPNAHSFVPVPFEVGDGFLKIGNLNYWRVDRGNAPLTLHGEYAPMPFFSSWPGDSLPGANSIEHWISFNEDGSFYERNFVGVVIGAADSSGDRAAEPQKDGMGTYRITGNTLELTYDGGEKRQFTFFEYEEDEEQPLMIVLDDVLVLRQGDPPTPADIANGALRDLLGGG